MVVLELYRELSIITKEKQTHVTKHGCLKNTKRKKYGFIYSLELKITTFLVLSKGLRCMKHVDINKIGYVK